MQILGALSLAYLGGLLSSLTPCVYPMIPITVSVVGGVGPKRGTWKELFFKSLSYIFGMALIYSFLGVLAGVTGKVFGSLTNTSGWYLALGAIMTLAALIMMEVIPFDPNYLLGKLKHFFSKILGLHKPTHTPKVIVEKETNLISAFLLGATSGFIAAPCTTPILTVILAYIAKTQSVGLGMTLMLSFSLGMGTLLLMIGLFAGAFRILPKSGQWLQWIKIGSGILLLIFSQYLYYKAGQQGGP